MATSRICSIPDCGKKHFGRGWCAAHWVRWKRYGDPLGNGTGEGQAQRYFREVVLAYEGDKCLPWPFANDGKGYGVMRLDGKIAYVHRRVCKIVHGPAPTPQHEAAHSCGHGSDACCTKRHLSWKTPIQNQADKIAHGTTNRADRCGTSKLTWEDVREIRSLKDVATYTNLAKCFGVSQATVSNIQAGKTWIEDHG